jgi:predicted TIM-barrel fold metal-dependent hydrolase
MGVDEAMLFPNYGLMWERRLSADLPALLANMGAWNRWCGVVAGNEALLPVGHVSLRDLERLDVELASLEAAGVKTAMIAPALVDGRPLSHPDLDLAWASFVEHDIAPVFHVADQPRVFADGWYPADRDDGLPVIDSVFLHTAAALACTDLIVNGTLEAHPDLRIGIVELSAVWVPMYLMMLDGGYDFTTRLNGSVPVPLSLRPSEYFLRQVRVSSFSYELPEHLKGQLQGAELLMACSDFPHSEGTAAPLPDYAATGRYGTDPERAPGLFHDNAAFLLGR